MERFGKDTEFSLITGLMQGHPQGTGPATPTWAPEFYGREDLWGSQDCLPAGVPRGPEYDHPQYAQGQVYLVRPGMWSRYHPPYNPAQDGSLLRRDRREMYGRLHPGAENTYEGPFKVEGVYRAEATDGEVVFRWDLAVFKREIDFFDSCPVVAYFQQLVPVTRLEGELLLVVILIKPLTN